MEFSLTEKLAVAAAFLALVAMVVGTEADPGVVVDGQEAVGEARGVEPITEAQQTEPSQPSRREWSLFRDGAAEAAAADIRGSGGIDPAPEPGGF